MIKDGHREETIKFAALYRFTYNNEICFVHIEPKSIVSHPARDITDTVTQLFSPPSFQIFRTNTAILTNIINNVKMCKQSPTY